MKNHSLLSKFHQTLARLDLRLMLILLVSMLFAITLLGSNPTSSFVNAQAQTGTATPVVATAVPHEPQPTPIPAEYLSNNTQTNGIVLGSVILVLIVVVGTLSIMVSRRDGEQ
jgi:hypothetical protein